MFKWALRTPGAAASAPVIALRDVRKVYGRGEGTVVALDGVSVALAAGSFTALMGPSRSAVALTATTLGPSLGEARDTIPAQILSGGQGGGLDAGVTAGSLAALHGDAIALGRHRAAAAHARVGDRVALMLGDGTPAHATVVAIYSRDLAFGDALLAPELALSHQTTPLLGMILVQADHPAAVAQRLQALSPRYPGLRVSDRASLATASEADREMNRWFGPQFVAEIFAFTSIAVVTTLIMIALRRGRELALLRLVGATPRQVRSMARWEAALILAIGLGVGLAIAATALLPLGHAFNGGLPYVPARPFAAIIGGTALLAILALSLPTRHALHARPIEAIGVRDRSARRPWHRPPSPRESRGPTFTPHRPASNRTTGGTACTPRRCGEEVAL